MGKCDLLDTGADQLADSKYKTHERELQGQALDCPLYSCLLNGFYYSPKLTIEPLPRMMAGGRGGGAGRSKLSDNGRTIFKISYLATGEQQFVLKTS